jgi:methionyl-tRNA formyltransferase
MESSIRDRSVTDILKQWKPDCFLVVGWYHMIPKSLLEMAPAYGLHASLLPDYSGGAPLVWAMINGEERTGISLFQLADGVDSGPIVGSRSVDIRYTDTIATLYARIEDEGLSLLSEFMVPMAEGTVETREQIEEHRRIFPQRSPADGRIDWASSADSLYDFIRAQTTPYPGAFTMLRGKKLTIWTARVVSPGLEGPVREGQVLIGDSGSIIVVCGGGGSLEILEVEYQGRNLNGADWYSMITTGDEGMVCFE